MSRADKGRIIQLQNRESRTPDEMSQHPWVEETDLKSREAKEASFRGRSGGERASQERPPEIFRRSPLEASDK